MSIAMPSSDPVVCAVSGGACTILLNNEAVESEMRCIFDYGTVTALPIAPMGHALHPCKPQNRTSGERNGQESAEGDV